MVFPVLNANDEHVAAMSAIAPGDVMWFGLRRTMTASRQLSGQHVHCDELDHPSFILDNGDGEHAEVTWAFAVSITFYDMRWRLLR